MAAKKDPEKKPSAAQKAAWAAASKRMKDRWAARGATNVDVEVDVNTRGGGGGRRGGGDGSRGRPRGLINAPLGDEVYLGGITGASTRFGAHVVVQFDQQQIGAVLTGMVHQLRNGDAEFIGVYFPELFPAETARARATRGYADERQIGRQAAKALPAAIRAYGITPEEWAAIYASAVQSPAFRAADYSGGAVRETMAEVVVQDDPRLAQPSAPFGSPVGQLGGGRSGGAGAGTTFAPVTSPFGEVR